VTVDHSSYLRRGASALAAVAVAGYLVDYVFNLGLTRFLSPHDYGDFKVAYAFGFFFGLALLLGGDRAAPRVLAPLIARGEARGTWEYLRAGYCGRPPSAPDRPVGPGGRQSHAKQGASKNPSGHAHLSSLTHRRE
jgi:hypothetical protein